MLMLLAACAKPVEAPADLDGLFHFFFASYLDGTDEDLRAAAENLAPLVASPSRGLVTVLTTDEQATIGVEGSPDPAEATGMFVAGPIACPLGDLERVHYALDQEDLYESATGDESYIDYERHYTSDFDAYEARETPFVTWHTTYTVKPVLTQYTAEIDGGMRFVAEADGVGPMVIERAVLPSPATFESETSDYFEQDYQLDLMLPSGDGAIHAYAVWRDLSSVGLTDEDEGVQNLILDGLEDFDRDTETVCAAGGF